VTSGRRAGSDGEPPAGESGPTPPDPTEELERVREELDRSTARLDATRVRSARQRDRFEALLEAAERLAADRGRALAETREDLARLRRQPLVRVGRRIGRSLPKRGPAASSTDAGPEAEGAPSEVAAATGSRPTDAKPSSDSGLRSIAIHIAPATIEAGQRWGDLAFSNALATAFERHGWHATVHAVDEWDSAASRQAAVALHLFGVRVPPVRPGQVSLLWVISHPDRVTARLCETYDLVFVASDPFRDQLADRIGTPVIALHQATDPDRFFPEPGGPQHEVLFVGNSRRVRRPILDAVGATNHDLAVYGSNWTEALLDPRYVRGTWIPNDELHRYYAAADIVLSDHWPDMRDEGFISNRVYDALASGGFVLSDRVPGMDDAFDDAVATFGPDDDLGSIIDRWLADPVGRRAAADRGRAAVLARHTFDHRVDAIIAALDDRPDRRPGGP
jgi:Glycosyl transferases group 1